MTTAPKPANKTWHEQAREMRAKGLSYDEIGFRLGVTGPGVYYALYPEKRSKKKKRGAEAPQSSPVSQAATE